MMYFSKSSKGTLGGVAKWNSDFVYLIGKYDYAGKIKEDILRKIHFCIYQRCAPQEQDSAGEHQSV